MELKKIDAQELKIILADLLYQVDLFCKKNNISYFLDAGTLIGAIRHKGFIPWDDDIDICMPRPDYNRFLEITKDKPINEYIKIYYEEDSLFPYIKICDTRTLLIEYPDTLRTELSVYIDVFPKDGLPDNPKKAARHCAKVKFYNNCYWFNKYSVRVWKKSKNVIKKMIAYIMYPLVKDKLYPLKKSLKLAQKYPYEKSRYVATVLAGGMANRVGKECFSKSIAVEFEGRSYSAPIGYDKYLRKLFSKINDGDYMIWPPEDLRVAHETEAYWKEGCKK